MLTDLTYLETMSGGDPNFIREMYDIFIEQVSDYREKMPALLECHDYEALSRVAHKATSTVAVMGMENDAKKLKDLELKAKEKVDIESYEEIINTFIKNAGLAIKELDELINNA